MYVRCTKVSAPPLKFFSRLFYIIIDDEQIGYARKEHYHPYLGYAPRNLYIIFGDQFLLQLLVEFKIQVVQFALPGVGKVYHFQASKLQVLERWTTKSYALDERLDEPIDVVERSMFLYECETVGWFRFDRNQIILANFRNLVARRIKVSRWFLPQWYDGRRTPYLPVRIGMVDDANDISYSVIRTPNVAQHKWRVAHPSKSCHLLLLGWERPEGTLCREMVSNSWCEIKQENGHGTGGDWQTLESP